MNRIVFLTYMSRSGSTFLSHRLNAFDDIGVSLEAEIPDGLSKGKLLLTNTRQVDAYLDNIYANEKFIAWQIPRENLRKRFADGPYPIDFASILHSILEEYFKKTGESIWLYKNGSYIRYHRKLRALFPEAKFIFILRDFRAIYASQKNALSSSGKRPMASYPVPGAFRYRKICSLLREKRHANWLIVLKYEDLICDTTAAVNRILRFLESTGKRNEKKDYAQDIPVAQKHLHPNIVSVPQVFRVDAWKNVLSNAELAMIQWMVGRDLNRNGYETVQIQPLTISDEMRLIIYGVRYMGRVLFRCSLKFFTFIFPGNFDKKVNRLYLTIMNRIFPKDTT